MKIRRIIDTTEIVASKVAGVAILGLLTPVAVGVQVGKTVINMGKEMVRIIEA